MAQEAWAEELRQGAARGDAAALERLLQREGGDVDARDGGGRTALHAAAAAGRAGAAALLLRAGAHIYAQDGDGRAPLHLAVLGDHAEAVRVLLRFGAYPYQQDGEARTAVALVHSTALTEVLLDFYTTQRANRAMVQRLEEDLLWRDIDEIMNVSREYSGFYYEESDDDALSAASSLSSPPSFDFLPFINLDAAELLPPAAQPQY